MSAAAWGLVVAAVVMLVAAVAVVTSARLVRTAFWLVVVFLGQAVVFLVLGADFLGWVQILISIGAVVVLVLFGLMLTSTSGTARARIGVPASSGWRRLGAAVVAAGFGALLLVAGLSALPEPHLDLEAVRRERSGGAQAIGQALFSAWVWPFELLSVLLLVALVGALVVSRRPGEPAGSTEQAPDQDGEG